MMHSEFISRKNVKGRESVMANSLAIDLEV